MSHKAKRGKYKVTIMSEWLLGSTLPDMVLYLLWNCIKFYSILLIIMPERLKKWNIIFMAYLSFIFQEGWCGG